MASWWSARPNPRRSRWPSLAARIPVPQRLPERYDGEPLRHLSPSCYSLWVTCPEAWRRRHIKGEKPPPSGSMFLGSRVDDALSAYHRRILGHGDRLALDQLLDIYREQWASELEAEQDKQGVDWEEDLSECAGFELGRQAIELAMAELIPHIGDRSTSSEGWSSRLPKALSGRCSATSTSRRFGKRSATSLRGWSSTSRSRTA